MSVFVELSTIHQSNHRAKGKEKTIGKVGLIELVFAFVDRTSLGLLSTGSKLITLFSVISKYPGKHVVYQTPVNNSINTMASFVCMSSRRIARAPKQCLEAAENLSYSWNYIKLQLKFARLLWHASLFLFIIFVSFRFILCCLSRTVCVISLSSTTFLSS